MTEAMQSHYETKYRIRTDLLPHCIPSSACIGAPTEMRQPKMARPTILYLGEVSPLMNHDALKVLAAASELLPKDYELLFCTSGVLSDLEDLGIRSSRLRVTPYGSRSDVLDLVSKAHLLIAPLSHKNGSPEEVRTVFSGKLLDYLISGRPILVFPRKRAPTLSARKNGWGYVANEDSPLALAAAIMRLITDDALSRQVKVHYARRGREMPGSMPPAFKLG